jgi:hypothetical protein
MMNHVKLNLFSTMMFVSIATLQFSCDRNKVVGVKIYLENSLCSFEPPGLRKVDALADQVSSADARRERPWKHENELARFLHRTAQRHAVRDQFFRGHLQLKFWSRYYNR